MGKIIGSIIKNNTEQEINDIGLIIKTKTEKEINLNE